MKKKLLKTIAVCLLGTTVLLTFTSCGGGTKTVSKYLTSKNPVVVYTCRYGEGGIGKDTSLADVLVFDGNSLTRYQGIPYSFGDIADMSDDEIIEACENTVAIIGEEYAETYDSYKLVCYTDSTGNNVSVESIQVYAGDSSYEYVGDTGLFYVGDKYEVYNAEFTALPMTDTYGRNPCIVLKDAPNIVLDDVGSDDVVIDP